jgi:hypothetical protein
LLAIAASLPGVWEAHMARDRLRVEGLFARVAHEHHIWVNWPYELALGGVKVEVLRSEFEQAAAILEQCRRGEYRLLLEAETGGLDDPVCPRCGSARFARRRSVPQLLLAVALYALAGIAFPLRSCVHRCESCGNKWNDNVRRFFLLGRDSA